MLGSVRLIPLHWTQHIRSYPHLSIREDEGGYVESRCRPDPDCDLRLKNGLFARDFEFQFSLIQGKLDEGRRQKARLSEDAIGMLVDREGSIHGWVYLARSNFSALWEQITAGRYERCYIDLMLKGTNEADVNVWGSNPLSITDVDIIFNRGVTQPEAKGGLFQRRR